MSRISQKQEQYQKSRRARATILSVMGVLTIVGMLVCGYGYAASNINLSVLGDANIKATVGLEGGAMQDTTVEQCQNAELHSTARFTDSRDNSAYWVTKMADGNCWMTENMNINPNVTMTSRNSDVTTTWRSSVNRISGVSVYAADAAPNYTRSYIFTYLLKDPLTDSSCGEGQYDPSKCSDQAVKIASNWGGSAEPNFYILNGNATRVGLIYDAHYEAHTYYQFNTATANTGSKVATGDATGSICPKGWKIPSAFGDNSFEELQNAEHNYDNGNLTFLPPYFFFPSGYAVPVTKKQLMEFGSHSAAYLWTKTGIDANNAYAYNAGTGESEPMLRYTGLPVRCVFIAEDAEE